MRNYELMWKQKQISALETQLKLIILAKWARETSTWIMWRIEVKLRGGWAIFYWRFDKLW